MRIGLLCLVLLASCHRPEANAPRLRIPSMNLSLAIPGAATPDGGAWVLDSPEARAVLELNAPGTSGVIHVRAMMTDWTNAFGAPDLDDCVRKLAGPLVAAERHFEVAPKLDTVHDVPVAIGEAEIRGVKQPSRGWVVIAHDGERCLAVDAFTEAAHYATERSHLKDIVESIWTLDAPK